MPKPKPLVLSASQISSQPLETFPDPTRFTGVFQTIFAAESTPTNQLTFGIARIPGRKTKTAYESLHRHDPAEIYYILSGEMVLLLDGNRHHVKAGAAVFIPGNAEHGFCNPSSEELVFVYAFPRDGFDGIEYRWSVNQPDWNAIADSVARAKL